MISPLTNLFPQQQPIAHQPEQGDASEGQGEQEAGNLKGWDLRQRWQFERGKQFEPRQPLRLQSQQSFGQGGHRDRRQDFRDEGRGDEENDQRERGLQSRCQREPARKLWSQVWLRHEAGGYRFG